MYSAEPRDRQERTVQAPILTFMGTGQIQDNEEGPSARSTPCTDKYSKFVPQKYAGYGRACSQPLSQVSSESEGDDEEGEVSMTGCANKTGIRDALLTERPKEGTKRKTAKQQEAKDHETRSKGPAGQMPLRTGMEGRMGGYEPFTLKDT